MKQILFFCAFWLLISFLKAQPVLKLNFSPNEFIHQSPYVPRSIKLQHVKSVKKYQTLYTESRDTTKRLMLKFIKYNETGQMTDSLWGIDLPNQKTVEAYYSYKNDGLPLKTVYHAYNTNVWNANEKWCLNDSTNSFSVIFDFFYNKDKEVSIRRSCGDGSRISTINARIPCTYADVMQEGSDTNNPKISLYYPIEYDYNGHFINKSDFFTRFKIDSVYTSFGHTQYILNPCVKGVENIKITTNRQNQLITVDDGFSTNIYTYYIFAHHFEPILMNIMTYAQEKDKLNSA